MNVEALVASMTPVIYEKLRAAVETGKWENGEQLSEEQKESCLQAVMIYQSKVLQSEQHMTIGSDGEIVNKNKQQLKQEFSSKDVIARFGQDDL